jgi:hypothetical protein
MAAVSERDQASVRHCLRDMHGDLAGDEVVIARNDQVRNAQIPQLRQQIVAVRLSGVAHQPVFDRSCLDDALFALVANPAFIVAISLS